MPECAAPECAAPERSGRVSREDWAELFVSCIREEGFVATVTLDGGVMAGAGSPAQEEAYVIASYVCKVRYPLDEKYDRPFSEAQVREQYEYFRTALTACLEEAGVTVGPAPSYEVYRQNLGTVDSWSPFKDVLSSPLPRDAQYRLYVDCPNTPSTSMTWKSEPSS